MWNPRWRDWFSARPQNTGSSFDIAKEAIRQVTEARLNILSKMEECMPSHRTELRDHAPRIEVVQN